MYRLLRFVPKNHASHLIGRLVHLKMPAPVARKMVGWFARTFGIDTESASRPLHEYDSIGSFFIRDLKEGLRPIEGKLVSPVDGTLRGQGIVAGHVLEQVKGRTYSLDTFLHDKELADAFADGWFFNFYLSPQDYHHVHSPVSGTVVRSVHIPGRLWPVNDWSLENIDNLFSVNERIVTCIESEFGLVAVVMVGATNVGKMSVVYDAFVSNMSFGARSPEPRVYDNPAQLEAGARLGTFHMGSSVVVLFRKAAFDPSRAVLIPPVKVRYGQALTR